MQGVVVGDLTKKSTIIMIIMVLMAIIVFAAFNVSCHSGCYSLCLLTVCAFILTFTGGIFLLGVNPLSVRIPANRGISIPFRLEKPPRS